MNVTYKNLEHAKVRINEFGNVFFNATKPGEYILTFEFVNNRGRHITKKHTVTVFRTIIKFAQPIEVSTKGGGFAYYSVPVLSNKHHMGTFAETFAKPEDETKAHKYEVHGIVFWDKQYWAQTKISGKKAYVQIEHIEFKPNEMAEIEKSIASLNTKKSATKDGFVQWYYPIPNRAGVRKALPVIVHMNPGPCLAYSVMMGHYYRYAHKKYSDPNKFFNEKVSTYYNPSIGALWGNFATVHTFDRKTLQDELKKGNPVIVSGNNGRIDHFVLAVSYSGNANDTVYEDDKIIIIDPLEETPFPTTYKDFKIDFPNDTTQFANNQYPMFTFH
ncbi:MAG: hypothetical protein FWH05_08070 [Oscillospiraceae bacterium]|nr:hypothetical protein [Oscillospiraceae bacterium]